MARRFNGLSFDIDLGEFAVHVQKFSLSITDNSAVASRNGRPDGDLPGSVEANGEIVVNREGLKVFTEAAKSAGSFQDLPAFDINSYAKCDDDEFQVEAFECKIKLESLLDLDKSSPDETEFAIKYDVTGKDFVKIDTVPYARVLENEK